MLLISKLNKSITKFLLKMRKIMNFIKKSLYLFFFQLFIIKILRLKTGFNEHFSFVLGYLLAMEKKNF